MGNILDGWFMGLISKISRCDCDFCGLNRFPRRFPRLEIGCAIHRDARRRTQECWPTPGAPEVFEVAQGKLAKASSFTFSQ